MAGQTPRFTSGNALALLENGSAFVPALLAAINAATHDVLIETYIFERDDVGVQIEAALQRAAQRGVRLLVDGVGARDYATTQLEALRRAGIEVLVYRPDRALLRLARSRMRRSHRKVQLIDGRVAFVGGINIVSDFAAPNRDAPQFDYAVQLTGPLIALIAENANKLWHTVGRVSGSKVPDPVVVAPQVLVPSGGAAHAAFVCRDNFRHRRDIERAYFQAVSGAESEIILACAYFFPGRNFRQALIAAAQRGVCVKLLLQGHTDHRFLQIATHAMYVDLLAAGIAIAEYSVAMLHAKVAVIDGRWATVGSSNLDPFSLLLNREANVVICDATFAAQLRKSLVAAIDFRATRVVQGQWAMRGWWARSVSFCAYHTARFVLAISGVAKG